MDNKRFGVLLSDAHNHLDELSRMVKDTIKAEEDIIDNILYPPLKKGLPCPNEIKGIS